MISSGRLRKAPLVTAHSILRHKTHVNLSDSESD